MGTGSAGLSAPGPVRAFGAGPSSGRSCPAPSRTPSSMRVPSPRSPRRTRSCRNLPPLGPLPWCIPSSSHSTGPTLSWRAGHRMERCFPEFGPASRPGGRGWKPRRKRSRPAPPPRGKNPRPPRSGPPLGRPRGGTAQGQRDPGRPSAPPRRRATACPAPGRKTGRRVPPWPEGRAPPHSCPSPAVEPCAHCGRPACGAHLVPAHQTGGRFTRPGRYGHQCLPRCSSCGKPATGSLCGTRGTPKRSSARAIRRAPGAGPAWRRQRCSPARGAGGAASPSRTCTPAPPARSGGSVRTACRAGSRAPASPAA